LKNFAFPLKFVIVVKGKVASTFPHTLSIEPTFLEAASLNRTGTPECLLGSENLRAV
jgi:hypothetical protein